MKDTKKQVRANNSAAATAKQTQTTRQKTTHRLVRVGFPAAVIPIIDEAAEIKGQTRAEFVNVIAIEGAESLIEDVEWGEKHRGRTRTAVPSILTTYNQARTGTREAAAERDLENARCYCADEFYKWHSMDPMDASAQMESLAGCLAHHPDLRAECAAMRTLSDGLDNIQRLMNDADAFLAAPENLALNDGERNAGHYFTRIFGDQDDLESVMGQLRGMGAIIADHKETEAIGRMLLDMEQAWEVLSALRDAVAGCKDQRMN